MSDNKIRIQDDDNSTLQKSKYFSLAYWRQLPTYLLPSIKSKISQLTLSQWFYLVAFILLLTHVEEGEDQSAGLMLVGVVAGVGLVRELWHVFNRIWEHMLGKGFILVMYAATANFALAVSALKINAITGIEPSPFIFTMGFATLLMLPFWLLMASVVFFSVALIAGNVWVIIGVLLRLVKVKIQVHWEDKVFVLVSMILRIILIPYVIMTIFYISVPYAKQIELFDHPIELLKQATDESAAESQRVDQTDNSEDLVVGTIESEGVKVTVDKRFADLINSEKSSTEFMDKLIAGFIYNFETYPRSACKKLPQQRSLPIDENLILLVTEDESELGYKFSVGPCAGNYTEDTGPPTERPNWKLGGLP